MKHLKTYEKTINKPDIWDYVVCTDDYNSDMKNFLENNIGKYICVGLTYPYIYVIEYEKPPIELKHYFGYDYSGNIIKNSTSVKEVEIVYWSKNKIDCERYIAANKYNI
jgi:hypothetical protein